MVRALGGCVGRILLLALLLVGAAALWFNRHEIVPIWDRLTGGGVQTSPELAARADEKLAGLGVDGGADRVALHQDELQSLIDYRWAGFLPADVADPRIAVGDGRVTLEGSVATARFGRVEELQEIMAFLPDTASLRAVGSFFPLDSGRVGLEVHELGAAGIPVPRQLIPTVLGRFRGSDAPGLGANSVAVPLPPGVRAVYVSGDSLVFLSHPRRGG
jgi:hypothetical protein